MIGGVTGVSVMTIIKQKLSINGLILRYYTYSTGIAVGYPKKKLKKVEKKQKSIKDSIYRTKKTITQLLECNEDMDKFVTLTFAIDPKKEKIAYYYFKNFIKRLRYYVGNDIKYLCVLEKGSNGRLHLHFVSDIPYIHSDVLASLWGKGFIKIKRIKYGTLTYYLTKYITKEIFNTNYKRRYYYSRSLDRPFVVSGFNALILYEFFKKYFKLIDSYNYYSKYCGNIKLKIFRISTKNIVEFSQDLLYKLTKPPDFYNGYTDLPKNMQLSLFT